MRGGMQNDEAGEKRMLKQTVGRRVCPFAENPLDDCLLLKMDSQHVEDAIYYCGGHFEECSIYRRHVHDL